jgi:hypothetical protein
MMHGHIDRRSNLNTTNGANRTKKLELLSSNKKEIAPTFLVS